MMDIFIYIAIFSLILFTIAVIARNDVGRQRRQRIASAREHTSDPQISDEEKATRRLIGDENYAHMLENVNKVVERHGSDLCASIALTSGPVDDRGWQRLHQLLPGDSLWLSRNHSEGVDCVDVMADGYLVGRLLLTAARKAIDILEQQVVTGVYVAEQNSYGDSDTLSLRIIMFYRPLPDNSPALPAHPAKSSTLSVSSAAASIFTVRLPDGPSFNLFQN